MKNNFLKTPKTKDLGINYWSTIRRYVLYINLHELRCLLELKIQILKFHLY